MYCNIAMYQFWNQDQTNTSNRMAATTLLSMGERDSNWQVGRYESVFDKLLAWCFSHQFKRVTMIAVLIKP